MNYQTFTDTVTPTLKSLGSFNNSLKIVLKTVFTTRISNIISDTGRCEGYCYWEYDVVSLNASILSNPENYAKAVAEFSIYGKADDGFKFYLNGTNITTFASVCNHGSCTSKSDWIPSLHSFEYSLTSKTNNLLIKAYSIKNDYWAEIYSAILTIKTESKQFTSTVKLSSNSSYATINKDIPVGYFFTNLGDDNSDALRGTWNADRTVKTVTSSTADWSDYLISGADIVFLNSDIHDGLTCLKFSDGRNVNIPQNFEVTIDKMIPFYEYHQGNDDPSFPTHRKDGYYFYLTISPIWFTSFSNANILLSNRNNMNGSYNFTFKFNYNNKDYSFKKTLVISF